MLNSLASQYAVLLVLLPFVGFVINGLWFRKISHSLASVIGIAACAGSFVLTVLLFMEFLAGNSSPILIHLYDWIPASAFTISLSFQIDQLTLVMLSVITGVGTLIHIYSASYMSHDEGLGKFFAYLNLFIFNMILLVMGGNYLVMFAGWEGVGLCSYLLIGFWNKNTSYNDAARKAFIMNRIGDLGFLLGLFLLLFHFHTLEYAKLFPMIAGQFADNDPTIVLITTFLFIGAMGKSAQIPLFTWLPDAMAGPTPVSALIHAATMVTAGIYMVIRSNALYALAPSTLEFIAIIGCATALYGAIVGLLQNDIKKVLAYSTVSQLGYMFLALGVGAYSASLFHVVTHAFFKALLFLGAGSVIHGLHNEQDIRKMGGLSKSMPITFITFLAGTVAIAGIPPLSGFFSKDEILLNVFMHNKVLWALGLLGSVLTAYYMFRLLILTFFGTFRGTDEQKHHVHESPVAITIPLIILAILAIGGGLLGIPHVFGGHQALATFLSPLLPAIGGHEVDTSLEITLMAVSVGAALGGIGLAIAIHGFGKRVPILDSAITNPLQKLVYNKFYIDEIYNALFVQPIELLSRVLHIVVEFLIIDLAVHGIARTVQLSGKGLRYLQSGSIGVYVFTMVVSMAIILFMSFI